MSTASEMSKASFWPRHFRSAVVIRVTALALAFAASALIARVLGPQQYGLYSMVIAAVALAAGPIHGGLAALLVRETARLRAQEEWPLLRGIIRAANGGVALVAVLSGALLLVAIQFFDLRDRGLWTIAAILLPFHCLASVRGAVLRGLQRIVVGQVPELIVRPAVLILAFGIIAQRFVSAEGALYANVVGAVSAFAVGSVALARALPAETRRVAPSYQTRVWLLSLLPFGLLAIVQIANSSLAVLIAGTVASPADAGYFRVAELGASLVLVGTRAADMTFAPAAARLFSVGDIDGLQRETTRVSRSSVLLALTIGAGLLLFGLPALTNGLGDVYAAAYWPMVILVLGQIVNTATGPVWPLLAMSGHEKEIVRVLAAAVVLLVLFGSALGFRFGAVGVALASAVVTASWNAVLSWRAKALLSINTLPMMNRAGDST